MLPPEDDEEGSEVNPNFSTTCASKEMLMFSWPRLWSKNRVLTGPTGPVEKVGGRTTSPSERGVFHHRFAFMRREGVVPKKRNDPNIPKPTNKKEERKNMRWTFGLALLFREGPR